MSNQRYLALVVIFILMTSGFIPPVDANTLSEELHHATEDYRSCYEALPAKARWGLAEASARGRRNWSKSLQKKVVVCLGKRRLKEDYEDIISLSTDLKSMYEGSLNQTSREAMEEEAERISSILIHSTRRLNERFKMANTALWHNFLIKLGAKEGGYCYQWTEELFKVLPYERLPYFERHWGVHNKGRMTENNAVIITKRGGPITAGIVYDAWRGKGRPFWRFVERDRQEWKELFTENEIFSEAFTVTPE